MQEGFKKEIWEQSKEWIEAISQVVNEMASKLGVASEHVYKVYTKQMFVEGLMEVISSILFSIIILVAFHYLRKFITHLANDDSDESWHIITLFVAIVVLTIVGIQLDDIRHGAMMMFNPEYYTMKDLLDTVRGLVNN